MYYPKAWARLLRLPQLDSSDNPQEIQHVVCNRDKILTALVTSDSIIIWYVKPCVPIISHRRSKNSVDELGKNVLAQWRPDSSMIVVVVRQDFLLNQSILIAILDFYISPFSDRKGAFDHIPLGCSNRHQNFVRTRRSSHSVSKTRK